MVNSRKLILNVRVPATPKFNNRDAKLTDFTDENRLDSHDKTGQQVHERQENIKGAGWKVTAKPKKATSQKPVKVAKNQKPPRENLVESKFWYYTTDEDTPEEPLPVIDDGYYLRKRTNQANDAPKKKLRKSPKKEDSSSSPSSKSIANLPTSGTVTIPLNIALKFTLQPEAQH